MFKREFTHTNDVKEYFVDVADMLPCECVDIAGDTWSLSPSERTDVPKTTQEPAKVPEVKQEPAEAPEKQGPAEAPTNSLLAAIPPCAERTMTLHVPVVPPSPKSAGKKVKGGLDKSGDTNEKQKKGTKDKGLSKVAQRKAEIAEAAASQEAAILFEANAYAAAIAVALKPAPVEVVVGAFKLYKEPLEVKAHRRVKAKAPFAIAVAKDIKARLGLMDRTNANELVVRRLAHLQCEEYYVRPHDKNRMVLIIIEMAFTPDDDDCFAKRIRKSGWAQDRREEFADAGSISVGAVLHKICHPIGNFCKELFLNGLTEWDEGSGLNRFPQVP